MAGNAPRALQLYRNFLRIYGDNPRAEDARNHVAALEKSIAEGGKPGPAPAPATADPAVPTPAPAPAPTPAPGLSAPAPQPQQPPALLERQAAAPASAGDDASPSLLRRPWFWVAVGAVVLGGTVALLLVTRGDSYPDATLGRLIADARARRSSPECGTGRAGAGGGGGRRGGRLHALARLPARDAVPERAVCALHRRPAGVRRGDGAGRGDALDDLRRAAAGGRQRRRRGELRDVSGGQARGRAGAAARGGRRPGDAQRRRRPDRRLRRRRRELLRRRTAAAAARADAAERAGAAARPARAAARAPSASRARAAAQARAVARARGVRHGRRRRRRHGRARRGGRRRRSAGSRCAVASVRERPACVTRRATPTGAAGRAALRARAGAAAARPAPAVPRAWRPRRHRWNGRPGRTGGACTPTGTEMLLQQPRRRLRRQRRLRGQRLHRRAPLCVALDPTQGHARRRDARRADALSAELPHRDDHQPRAGAGAVLGVRLRARRR